MRIDFHCHVFQKHVTREALGAIRQFEGYGFYERMLGKIQDIETIKTDDIIQRTLYHVKKAGLDKVVLLPVNRKENEIVKNWCKVAPDIFIPFYNPPEKESIEVNVKEVIQKAIKEDGYKGFKIMLSFREKKLNDKILYPTLEVAEKYKVPILMHTGYPPPGTRKNVLTYSNPIVIDEFINSFPKANIIIAHMGFPWTDIAIALATQYPNIYLDISNMAYMMPKRLEQFLLQAKEIIGTRKILFGSDGSLPEMIEIAFDYINNADFLTKEDIDNILGLNAQKLLHLE
ncbi:MAG: amidohydrolase family protein [Promethearchaeota archaeon]